MQVHQPKRTLAPHKILLAAANQAGTKARKMVLEEKGHHVIVASKAKDALHHMENDGLALVIVDFNLEQGKGLTLLEEVCAHETALPTILLAEPVQEMELDGSSCRPDIVVAKQFDEVAQLLKAVDKLLRRRVPRKRPGNVQKPPTAAAKHG
ncbi:MAG: response regulator [Bryobacterales bacterium]|nr:response regulator [Bryobacterales bacterium]